MKGKVVGGTGKVETGALKPFKLSFSAHIQVFYEVSHLQGPKVKSTLLSIYELLSAMFQLIGCLELTGYVVTITSVLVECGRVIEP